MDKQSNNAVNILNLKELKLFLKDITDELQVFRQGVTEEIYSLKKEIINLGEKITSLKCNIVNTEGDYKNQEENIDSKKLARNKIECLENTHGFLPPNFVEDAFDNLNEGSTIDNDGTDISEPKSNNKLINDNDNENVQSGLNSTSPNLTVCGQVSILSDSEFKPEITGIKEELDIKNTVWNLNDVSGNVSEEESILTNSEFVPEITAIKEELDDTNTVWNLNGMSGNVSEEESIFGDSDFVPETAAIEIQLDDSVKNLRSRSRSSNENIKTKVNNEPLNSELDLHETRESSLNGEVNNCEQYITLKKISFQESSKYFCLNENIAQHVRIHAKEKPFKCQYCGDGFSCSSTLKNHVRVHTGEKPFNCQYCGKGFVWSSSLKRHVIIHTGEKPFKCPYCGKDFAWSCNLKNHVRIHTGEKPFKCQFCDKDFAQSSSLKQHIGIHTGEKPFKCPYCGKGFSWASRVKEHVRIHTGEKPFKCSYCDKDFAKSSSLKEHVGIHSQRTITTTFPVQ